MSLLMANKALIKQSVLTVIPTFIIIGDPNADGRGNLPGPSGSKYFSEWAVDRTNEDKTTVKIFDSKSTNTFLTLNKTNANVNNASYTHGFEQTIGIGLAKHYGSQEIRFIKYGKGSTTAGGTGTFSWQPGQTIMNEFEVVYANAISAASSEGVQLQLIACISFLGTNDAANLTLANNYEANMTTVIAHLRDNIFTSPIPFIITSCTDGVTYMDIVRTAQQSLCGNVDDCYYFNLRRFGISLVHPLLAGIFTGGLEIARTIITTLLSGSDYMDDYIFSFQTNRSGAYSIGLNINETICTEFYIDWGDGSAETEINTRLGTYNHTYADGTTKTVKIKMMCPWNFFSLSLNASGNSKIVGTFDISQLTGLDTFEISDASGITELIEPIQNYATLTALPNGILYLSTWTSFDLRRYLYNGVGVISNANLVSVVDTSTGKTCAGSVDMHLNPNLESVDLATIVDVTGYFYCYNNIKLTTLKHPMGTSMYSYFWAAGNTILTEIQNYQYSIYNTNYDVRNCDLSRTNVDNIINEMWARCQDVTAYRNTANKTAYFGGNNGVTGTFDGTTDWSGGLPTSPAAKAYDLLNDVTGTHNFSTF